MQSRAQGSSIFHARVDRVETATAQFAEQEHLVVFRILDDEDSKRLAHVFDPGFREGSLISNQ